MNEKECVTCKKSFKRKKRCSFKVFGKRLFCSNTCRGKSISKTVLFSCWLCKKEFFEKPSSRIHKKTFCNKKCADSARIGTTLSEEHKEKIGDALRGIRLTPEHTAKLKGRKLTLKQRKRISEARKRTNYMFGRTGNLSPNWKGGLEMRKKEDRRNDSAYQEWRRQLWIRDGYKCKVKNKDCNGRIEAHHILSWRNHRDLRYIINNGITLCQFHHPRKRVDEQRLIPTFNKLVGSNKILF